MLGHILVCRPEKHTECCAIFGHCVNDSAVVCVQDIGRESPNNVKGIHSKSPKVGGDMSSFTKMNVNEMITS